MMYGTFSPRFCRSHPVIVGASILRVAGANEGEVFRAGNIAGVAAMKVATWVLFLIQLEQRSGCKHLLNQTLVLSL
jgi:hypothetical protein